MNAREVRLMITRLAV